jgi:hypothetical protein
MNVTTLIVPLWAVAMLAKRIIPAGTAYVDLRYRDVLALSAMYQGGVVAWVAFWAFYGQGFGAGKPGCRWLLWHCLYDRDRPGTAG